MQKLTRKQAAEVLALTFPEYRGRKLYLQVCQTVHIYNLHWDGGTRNRYVGVRLDGLTGGALNHGSAPWADPVEGQDIELPAGVVVACHTTACGQDCGITFYCNPATVQALPAQNRLALG